MHKDVDVSSSYCNLFVLMKTARRRRKLYRTSCLKFLCSIVTVPEFQCRLRWGADDFVIWDIRSVQHYAVADYGGMQQGGTAPRLMEHAATMGDTPFFRRDDATLVHSRFVVQGCL